MAVIPLLFVFFYAVICSCKAQVPLILWTSYGYVIVFKLFIILQTHNEF